MSDRDRLLSFVTVILVICLGSIPIMAMSTKKTMKYKTITYQRVKNLGNYESERLEITAEVKEDEEINEAIERVKEKVLEGLHIQEEIAF